MSIELLTVSQTAKYLQLSEKTVRRMIEMEIYQHQNWQIVHGVFVHVTLMSM